MLEDQTNNQAHFSFDVVGQSAPVAHPAATPTGSTMVTSRGPARSQRYVKSQRLSLADIHALDEIEAARAAAEKTAAAAAAEAARCEAVKPMAGEKSRGIFRSLFSRVCSLALVTRRA